jgi:deoxycytidylate deaminase
VLTGQFDNIEEIFKRTIKNPELIFGIVGPIGVDVEHVVSSLEKELDGVNYKTRIIHITKVATSEKINIKIDESSYASRYKSLIRYGNAFREIAKTKSAFAGIAISKIRAIREEIAPKNADNERKTVEPAFGTAYIVRQFKRPEEIELMRRTYGRKFIQVSVFGSPIERRKALMAKIRAFNSAPKSDEQCEKDAIDLIEMDNNQKDEPNGQRLADVFHLGDVFVDGIEKKRTDETIRRFIVALFGDTHVSPTKDEYGLYIATAASLRSVDLSRQVGAAIFSKRGEVVSLGCNEVPKATGGTYWADDPMPIARDVERGSDPNQDRRNEILYDLLDRMTKSGFLSSQLESKEDVQSRVDELLSDSLVADAQLMDIIEYGRIIHAEMLAISDAARLGRATGGATLFCTTFPCHLCAKHIVAAGMERVVFLEPYPKSYAHKLHSDSITFDRSTSEDEKVLFEPFIGISPRRYRDIFEKKKRKDATGRAKNWYEGEPIPLIEDKSGSYIYNEEAAIILTLKELFSSPLDQK